MLIEIYREGVTRELEAMYGLTYDQIDGRDETLANSIAKGRSYFAAALDAFGNRPMFITAPTDPKQRWLDYVAKADWAIDYMFKVTASVLRNEQDGNVAYFKYDAKMLEAFEAGIGPVSFVRNFGNAYYWYQARQTEDED